MTKSKPKPQDDPEQSKWFIKAAREAGAGEKRPQFGGELRPSCQGRSLRRLALNINLGAGHGRFKLIRFRNATTKKPRRMFCALGLSRRHSSSSILKYTDRMVSVWLMCGIIIELLVIRASQRPNNDQPISVIPGRSDLRHSADS
jgi:hypothetical protein